jgi:hypothetical protein
MIAGYNGGPNACRESDSCPGQKWYECTLNPKYQETRNYVAKVMGSVQTCQNLQLVNYLQAEQEENKDDFQDSVQQMDVKYGENVILGKYAVVVTDKSRKPFVDPFAPAGTGTGDVEVSYEVKVGLVESGYGGTAFIEIARETFDKPLPDSWYEFSRFPFVSFRFGKYSPDSLKMEFITWKKSIVNVGPLMQNVMEAEGGGTGRKLTPVWSLEKGVYPIIWAYYTGGTVTLFNDVMQPFCNIPWGADTVYGYCDDRNVYPIQVTNIKTVTRALAGEPLYAEIQVKHDPNLQNSCCGACTGCSILECAICEKCRISQTLNDEWLRSYSWSGKCEKSS